MTQPLKASKNGSTCILVRFRSKLLKAAIMKSKKEYFTANPDEKFSLSDDLTQYNAKLLKQTKNHPDTESAWSLNGRIKYKKKGDTHVYTAKIHDLQDCSLKNLAAPRQSQA